MANIKKFEFYDEENGVWVVFSFPPKHANVYVEEMDLYTPPDGETFKPKRPVINVKFFEKYEKSVEYPRILKVDFKLRVHYIQKDIDNADGEDNLMLGYWDGSTWTTFSKEEHDLEQISEDGDKWKGYFKAKLSSWPDPLISWGP